MNEQHSVTPPTELVKQWWDTMPGSTTQCLTKLATQAARWGWDQREGEMQKTRDEELEACVQILYDRGQPETAAALLRVRRPEPLSYREQALILVPEPGGIPMKRTYSPNELLIIRRALESLPQ